MSKNPNSVEAKVARLKAERQEADEQKLAAMEGFRQGHCCPFHEAGGNAMERCGYDGQLYTVIADLIDAARTFVRRCEAGEIRSRKTYHQMREILSRLDKGEDLCSAGSYQHQHCNCKGKE